MKDFSLQVERVVAPVREQIVANLRNAIIEQRFRPGERLVERELCELTGVSRTSVREALRRLESEGLVTTTKNGAVVATVSPTEARDLYQVRGVLEALAGELFAERATDEQIAALHDAVEAIEDSQTTGDPRSMLTAKSRFYAALFAGAGNPVITLMLDSLHARISVLRATSLSQPGRPRETLREMFEILEAVERRDAAGVATACRAHVEGAARAALGALRTPPEAGPPRAGSDDTAPTMVAE